MTKRPGQKEVVSKVKKKPLDEAFDEALAAGGVEATEAEAGDLGSVEMDPDKIAVSIFIRENERKTPVIGVRAVADFLGYSMRTIHSWRAEFPDFPVKSDGASCVWRSTEEDLKAWQEAHLDLFSYRKERQEAAERYKKQLARRRRWS